MPTYTMIGVPPYGESMAISRWPRGYLEFKQRTRRLDLPPSYLQGKAYSPPPWVASQTTNRRPEGLRSSHHGLGRPTAIAGPQPAFGVKSAATVGVSGWVVSLSV